MMRDGNGISYPVGLGNAGQKVKVEGAKLTSSLGKTIVEVNSQNSTASEQLLPLHTHLYRASVLSGLGCQRSNYLDPIVL